MRAAQQQRAHRNQRVHRWEVRLSRWELVAFPRFSTHVRPSVLDKANGRCQDNNSFSLPARVFRAWLKANAKANPRSLLRKGLLGDPGAN